jgi:ATP-dependent DNA helicase RecG
MPSALETLIKILKLERDQGCDNRAVIGGLAAYSVTWKRQAQAQARRPEHHVLAEEIGELLKDYEQIDSQLERMRQIDYMMSRITGRKPAPQKYKKRLQQIKQGDIEEEIPVLEDDPKTVDSYGYDSYEPVKTKRNDIAAPPRLARPPRPKRDDISLEEAKKRLHDLQQPVTAIKGIGKSTADDLAKMDLRTIQDMLDYLPRRYDDYTKLRYIRQLNPDEVVTVIGTVKNTRLRTGRSGRKDFMMVLDDGTAELHVTFFGQHWLIRQIRKGRQVVLSGKTSIWRNQLQMANPEWEALDSENLHTAGIVPVYSLTEGVGARSFRRLMKKAIDQYADLVPDAVPEPVLERSDLADMNWTYKNLHFPEGPDHYEHARRRYLFDQLLTLQLGILGTRREWQSVPGFPLTVDDGWLDDFIDSMFPYELTGAQWRAVHDIREDVTRDIPMNRLLQGDVGAGKTAVAITAMAMAVQNRKQAALMAPTSILAEQHYRGIEADLRNNWLDEDFKPVIALLTGALSTAERESIYRGIADGSIDVVIGTHALIQERVEFNELAVAIVDEQHRFGVEQRAALRGKGTNPHLLVMTATPIPRTLALTLHADLDLSIIDEKPPGRQPVQTQMLRPVERERAFSFIEGQIKQGRQAFIVHPLVEDSESIDARSAVTAYEELQQVFYQYRVCLLHGRMSPSEKDRIMAEFADGEYDVMVTTSVAEVGVDVPNASVILIEGANRFGLAQLHQFRGRVGRGAHQSFCLLIPDKLTDEAQERLEAMEKTNDGFQLAEMDWKMRGAGDLLGTRQSGGNILQIAEHITPQLVQLSQQEARTIYEEDPYLEQEQHQLLRERVEMRTSNADVS